jgi:hypothetical protein
VRPAGLHRTLCVANLLQHTPTILKSLREQVLLLRNLSQQNAQLVADIAQGLVVGALAPLAQLASNGRAFFGCLFISVDRMVLGLDQLVEFLGQLGLLGATQRGQREVRFARGAAGVVAALGADRVGAADVPMVMLDHVLREDRIACVDAARC